MWKCKTYQSEWKSGSTAGGSGNTNQGIVKHKNYLNEF
jgi:hypothetical protein